MATKLGGRVVMQCAAPFILPKTEWTITHSAHPPFTHLSLNLLKPFYYVSNDFIIF